MPAWPLVLLVAHGAVPEGNANVFCTLALGLERPRDPCFLSARSSEYVPREFLTSSTVLDRNHQLQRRGRMTVLVIVVVVSAGRTSPRRRKFRLDRTNAIDWTEREDAAVWYGTVRYGVVLCCAVLCYAVLYCAVLRWCAVPFVFRNSGRVVTTIVGSGRS